MVLYFSFTIFPLHLGQQLNVKKYSGITEAWLQWFTVHSTIFSMWPIFAVWFILQFLLNLPKVPSCNINHEVGYDLYLVNYHKIDGSIITHAHCTSSYIRYGSQYLSCPFGLSIRWFNLINLISISIFSFNFA